MTNVSGEGEEEDEEESPPTNFGQLFEAWRLIIRPPRRRYGMKSLGPNHLQVILPSDSSKRLSRPLERQDLELRNARGEMLKCSHFMCCEPIDRHPCVVFCHGSSSCRVDAFQIMPFLFEHNLSVFCFDFAGSGLSGGEYVTLGHREEDDLRTVIDYLSRHPKVSNLGLWGKSMGAVASILRASKDRRVDACVLDSPFADFARVVADYCENTAALQWVPRSAIDWCLARVCGAVQERVGFDPREVRPLLVVGQCHCPALFASAEEDRVVSHEQVKELQNAWKGESRFYRLPGGHNTDRPTEFLREAAGFMWEALRNAEEADELLCGAVDAYLAECSRSTSRSWMEPKVWEEDQLHKAVECYLDQRECLEGAIESFLLKGGAIPRVSPRWPHLTSGHPVRPLSLMEDKRAQIRNLLDCEGASNFSI